MHKYLGIAVAAVTGFQFIMAHLARPPAQVTRLQLGPCTWLYMSLTRSGQTAAGYVSPNRRAWNLMHWYRYIHCNPL